MSSLLKSNIVVAMGTALSRITGLARVVVFGVIVGQTGVADVYNSANNSPNAVYELLLGGVLSASLVPLFAKQSEDDDDEATSAIFTVSMVAVTVLTAIAVLGAPLIFGLFSNNLAAGVDTDQYRSAGTALTRIFLIQIFFYGTSALVNALLNARRKYFAAAWAPVLSNIVIIGSLLLIPAAVNGKPELGEILTNARLRWTLGLGATVGIAVMAVAVLPALRRTGVRLRWNFDLRHPAVRQLVKLSTWTFGYVVANQVAVITILNLTEPGTGNFDAYSKAYIFFVLPHGLLAMSIATTFVPEMARSVKRRDREALIDRTSLGIRLVALLTVPAGFLLFTLRRPIVGLVLQHGNFSADSALATSRALGGFALGLVGYSVYLFVLRAFYTHGDGRTPFVINVFENLINIGLGVLFVGRYGVLGLGLAFALAYLVSALWALSVLGAKVPGFPTRAVVLSIVRMLLAAVVMAEMVWAVARGVGANDGVGALSRVVAGSVVGIIVYLAVLVALDAPELRQLRARMIPTRATGTAD